MKNKFSFLYEIYIKIKSEFIGINRTTTTLPYTYSILGLLTYSRLGYANAIIPTLQP